VLQVAISAHSCKLACCEGRLSTCGDPAVTLCFWRFLSASLQDLDCRFFICSELKERTLDALICIDLDFRLENFSTEEVFEQRVEHGPRGHWQRLEVGPASVVFQSVVLLALFGAGTWEVHEVSGNLAFTDLALQQIHPVHFLN
jgi:hypothetical protein